MKAISRRKVIAFAIFTLATQALYRLLLQIPELEPQSLGFALAWNLFIFLAIAKMGWLNQTEDVHLEKLS